MRYYKLNHQGPIFKFSLEEVDRILKYRFNAKECSGDLDNIQTFSSNKAICKVIYEIADKNLIESIRLPEEKEELEEFIRIQKEE